MNYNVNTIVSFKIKVQLEITDIPADCDVAIVAIAEVGLFYLIFRLIITYLIIKIVFFTIPIVIIIMQRQQLA